MNDYPISPKSIVQYGPANLGRKKFNKQEEKGLNLERWSYFFLLPKTRVKSSTRIPVNGPSFNSVVAVDFDRMNGNVNSGLLNLVLYMRNPKFRKGIWPLRIILHSKYQQ